MRSQLNTSLLRLRSDIANTLAQYMASVGCVQTHTPIITSSDCEGAGEVFTVTSADAPSGESKPGQAAEPFFSSPKYLTVSGQLHLEALAQAVGNVWTLSPTFRAEKSDTPRHLSEFYMLEVELAFVDRLDDVMGFLESMVRSIVTSLYDSATASSLRSRHGLKNTEDLVSAETVEQRWRGLMAADWPRITYMQAIEVLRSSGKRFEHMPVWGEPLSTEHEKYLARVVGGDMHKPVFVTAYPRHFKAFYMLPSEDTSPDASCHGGETAECFDLLVPDLCELAGGSLREHRLEPLLATMRARGMALPGETAAGANGSAATPDSSSSAVPADAGVDGAGLGWYVDLRRWGCPPHGGFGLGFDRLLAYLAGVPSVRDVVAFPRWYGRCNC